MKIKSPKMGIFDIVNCTLMLILAAACLVPFIHVLSVSLSDSVAVSSGRVGIFPEGFNFDNYKYALTRQRFLGSMLNSVVRVVLAVSLNLVFAILAAYPLSKKDSVFPGRTILSWFFVITMLVGGGIVPRYLVIDATGLLNSVWALVIPSAVNAFFITILLNFFRGIPEEIEESAVLDGAGNWRILICIYVPLAIPALATMVIYSAVGHWNEWFEGMIYMNSVSKYPLSSFLRNVVTTPNFETMNFADMKQIGNISNRAFVAAQIILATLPIILVYPFFQRYFIKGMTMGSVKG